MAVGLIDYVAPADRIPWTNGGSDVAAGDVVVLSSGVSAAYAERAIPAGQPGWLSCTGLVTAPKATGGALNLGVVVYWDATNKVVTTTSSSNTKCGIVVVAAATNDTTVQIRWIFGA